MNPVSPDAIYYGGLVVLLLLLAREWWRYPARYDLRDSLTNALMYAGYVIVGALWLGTLWAIYRWAWDHRLFDLGPYWLDPTHGRFWASWLALLVLEDFCFYWFHRASHRLPLFWASHVTHHSSPYFNFSTALRQSWIPFHTFVFWLPLPFLGFDPLMVITMQLANLFFQALQHTTYEGLPRWWTYLFNAPQHHRVHHACNPELVDRNFAGIFIVWDRLFGTYAEAAQARGPVRFGIEPPPASTRLLWLQVHGWVDWLRGLRRGLFALALAGAGLAGVLVATPAPAADYMDLQAERTARNVGAVESYHGVLGQRGLYGKTALVSEVSFRRPHEFRVRVTAPPELAGTQMSYHDDTLVTWWPAQELAVVIRGFVAPSTAGEESRIVDAYRDNLANYFYGLGPVKDVAGLPTIQVDQRARSAAHLVQSSLTRVYDDHSFPLSGQVTFRGGATLDYGWQSIRFNDASHALPAPPVLPPSTMVMAWDLAWPARGDAELAARLPAARPFPATLAGLPRAKALVHPESLPAVAAWYRDENYYLLVTASRDTGWNPFAHEYGIAVPLGGASARLVISPLNSSWVFRRDGVVYTVLTNVHPETAYAQLALAFAPPAAAKATLQAAPAGQGTTVQGTTVKGTAAKAAAGQGATAR